MVKIFIYIDFFEYSKYSVIEMVSCAKNNRNIQLSGILKKQFPAGYKNKGWVLTIRMNRCLTR